MTKNKTTNDKSSGKSQNEGYGIFDLLWLAITDIPRIMRTLKFAVWVIIILAIFTLFGTILPQEKFASDPETFAAQYVGLFNIDDTDGKTTFGEFLYYGFVRPFELYRVYESGLYLTLLMVLSISSALCAWDRWKITRTLATKTNPKANPDSVRTSQYSSHGTVTSNIETVTEKARSLLASKGFRTFETTDENGTVYFFGRKNFIKHYASVGFHFAFVFILIGGIIGHDQFFGYEGRIALSEGEERPVGPEMNLQRQAEAEGKLASYVPKTDELIRLVTYENIYRERDFGNIDPLTGFPMKYDGSPSDYVSHLEIIKPSGMGELGETILAKKAIEVNHPLKHGGVSYYQLAVDSLITLSVLHPGGRSDKIETFMNQPFEIRGYDHDFVCVIRPMDYVGGVWEAADGTRSQLSTVIRLVDYKAFWDGITESPVLLGYVSGESPLSIAGVTIVLTDVKEYTVLQYVRDPGVPLVYFGGLLLMIGLIIALYFPFRTVRVILKPEQSGTSFVAGGNVIGFPDLFVKVMDGERVTETDRKS